MNLWVQYPQQMANARRRRDALVKAILGPGYDLRRVHTFEPAAEDFYTLPGEPGQPQVRALTLAGLEKLAKHLGIEIPPEAR